MVAVAVGPTGGARIHSMAQPSENIYNLPQSRNIDERAVSDDRSHWAAHTKVVCFEFADVHVKPIEQVSPELAGTQWVKLVAEVKQLREHILTLLNDCSKVSERWVSTIFRKILIEAKEVFRQKFEA